MADESWHTAKPRQWDRLKPAARRLRADATDAESLLWEQLRGAQLGVRFRRQHVIDHYVVDFCCLKANLIVEVDGPIHAEQRKQDAFRQGRLEQLGFHTLRVSNDEVTHHIDHVLERIRQAVNSSNSDALNEARSPSPVGEGAGG